MKSKILGSLFVLILIGVVVNDYYVQFKLSNKGVYTEGKVVDFYLGSKTEYSLEYEYFVNGRRYESSTRSEFFKCDNGKKGCIGKSFEVYYLPSNPSVSEIDLKEYEKYRNKFFYFSKPKRNK